MVTSEIRNRLFDFWRTRPITDPYGTPRSNALGFHTGIDFGSVPAGVVGEYIPSLTSGTVIESNSNPNHPSGYGKFIHLRTEANESVFYGHFHSNPLFTVGDNVTLGAFLGQLGNTGISTGPHVHVEARRGLAPFNWMTVEGTMKDTWDWITGYGVAPPIEDITYNIGGFRITGSILNCVYQAIPREMRNTNFIAFIYAVMVAESEGFSNARRCGVWRSAGNFDGGSNSDEWPSECFRYRLLQIPSSLCNPNTFPWMEDSVGLFQLLRCVGQGGFMSVPQLEDPSRNARIAMPALVDGWVGAAGNTSLELKVRTAAILSGHPGGTNLYNPGVTNIWNHFQAIVGFVRTHGFPLAGGRCGGENPAPPPNVFAPRPYGTPPRRIQGPDISPYGRPPD